jgi:hypothetical protein
MICLFVCLCRQDAGSDWNTVYKWHVKRQPHISQTFLLHHPRRLDPALVNGSRDHDGCSQAEASRTHDREMQIKRGNDNLSCHMVFLENFIVTHPVNNSPAFKVHYRVDRTPATTPYQLNPSTLQTQFL